MPTTCEILFDQPNGVYHSGNILNGKVKLVTTSEKTAKAIHIIINGTGKVRWEERKSRRRNGKTESYMEVYSSHENYLSSKTFVFGNEGGSTFSLPPGIHEYTFSALLPQHLPTSFSGKYGHVRYEVVVTIDRPLRFDNVFKQAFTVIQNLDLNLNPAHLQPKEDEAEKYFCCCLCASGPIKTKLSIPFGGFAPGQKLKYTILIDNEASNDVEGATIKLTQQVIYVSRTPHKKTRHEGQLIASEVLEGAIRFSKKKIDKEFQIPALPPSTSSNEAIIKIEYFLTAEIETGACHLNDAVKIPIVVGTVPLYASATNPNSVITVQPTAPFLPPGYSASGDAPPPYPSIAVPPSFEDATGFQEQFVDTDDDPNTKQEPFIPKYPMYYNFAAPSAPPNMNPIRESPFVMPANQTETESTENGLPIPPYPITSIALPYPTNSEMNYPPNIGWTTK